MAECEVARITMQRSLPRDSNDLLDLELQDKDRKVERLSQSNGQLEAEVHQLKAIIKDAHVRYENDLQRTVATLQDQYQSAVDLMQLGVDFAAANQTKAALRTSSQTTSATSVGVSSVTAASSGCCTGVQRPSATSSRMSLQQQQQPLRPEAQGAACRCARGSAQAAVTNVTSLTPKKVARKVESDSRFTKLGVNPDDFSPSTAYGASVGLTTEPLAVLRDVLNLDGHRDGDGDLQQYLQSRSLSAGTPLPAAADAGSSLVAQAQFEARMRGAYRSMLLQLQHRYQLERERQEDAHQAALQEQDARHLEELQQLANDQEADVAAVSRRLERQEAVWGAEVVRLEAELAAAKTAAESSQSQAAAARAAAENLEAQQRLLRSTHEAELQHVRQGSIPLQEHLDILRQLRSEWEAALHQRERDYSALLEELREVRRQMSSNAEQARSSEDSCAHGPSGVPPLRAVAGSHPEPAPPYPTAAAVLTRPEHDPFHTASSCMPGRFDSDSLPAAPYYQPQQPGSTPPGAKDRPQQILHPPHDTYSQNYPHNHHNHHSQPGRQQQRDHCDADGTAADMAQLVPVVQPVPGDSGTRCRVDSMPSCMATWHGHMGGGGGGGGERPVSPAVSAHSVAHSVDSVRGPLGAEDPATTPRSPKAAHGRYASAVPAPPPPSSSSSRLSELVDAVVHGSSSARRGLSLDGPAAIGRDPTRASQASVSNTVAAELDAILAAGVYGIGDSGGGSGGDTGSGDLASPNTHQELWLEQEHKILQQEQQQKQQWQQQRQRRHKDRVQGDAVGGNSDGGGGNRGGNVEGGGGVRRCTDLGSPDEHNSEVTLGRWQQQREVVPDDDPWDKTADWPTVPQRHLQPQPQSQSLFRISSTSPFAAAVEGARRALDHPLPQLPPRQQQQQQRQQQMTGVRQDGDRAPLSFPSGPGGRDGVRPVGLGPPMQQQLQEQPQPRGPAPERPRRSPSPPSRFVSPLRGGGRMEVNWSRSGHPTAAVLVPRCLRCGLNESISPGCCRFHPALLGQPGGLRFTPEFMTCQAADHTDRLPGCLVRKEHFYEPQGLLTSQAAPALPLAHPVSATQRQHNEFGFAVAGGKALEKTKGVEQGCRGDGRGGGVKAAVGGMRIERRSSRAGGAVSRAGAAVSPRRGATATRSPLRRGTLGTSHGGCGGAGGGAVGDSEGIAGAGDSPSPKPRTRLPSPVQRK